MPFALQRSQFEVQRFRGFLVGQAQRELQFDHSALLRRLLSQLVEEDINGDGLLERGRVGKDALWQCFDRQQFRVRSASGVVDQEAAHDDGGDGEEVTTILPVDVFRSSQSKECFVDQCRGLQSVARPLSPEATRGNGAEIGHQHLEQALLGLPIASPPSLQQFRNAAGVLRHFFFDVRIIANFGVWWRTTIPIVAFLNGRQTMRKGFLVLMIAVVMTGQVKADDPQCIANDTMQSCFDKLSAKWAKASAPRAQESTTELNTGVSGLLTPTQSTTMDFLSKLSGAFAVPMSGDGSRPVSLAWNIPIRLLGGDEERVNLQAVFAKPEMSPDLKQRIESNAAAVTAVNDSLSEFDDLTVSASFGPSMRVFGRSLTPHRAAYEAMLSEQMSAALADVTGRNGITDMTTKLGANTAAIETSADAAAMNAGNRFADQFSILLNNQPQIYGEVEYRALKDVAGPDQRAARFTYEMGFHNLNAFYAAHPECGGAAPAANCASALMDAAKAANDAPEDRVAVSIEYRKWNAWNVFLPDLANFSARGARSFVYSVTYGRNHMMTEKGRLDVEVNYEDTTARTVTDVVPPALFLTGDKTLAVRDRFVASATYTYKINGQMAMPLTLTYANHGSFLGDVDRKLNAHFGLSFKMPSQR